ncbi:MAG: hypothetical protein ACK5MW_05235 [Enterococcus sp.]
MDAVKLGQSYICKPIGLENSVVGVIERTYINTVLINVESCEQEDRVTVLDRQNRMLVKFCDIYSPYGVTQVV